VLTVSNASATPSSAAVREFSSHQRKFRILELRDANGPGGGPEKTILHGAAMADAERFDVTVCYIKPTDDDCTSISDRAERLDLDYCEIRQRGIWDLSVSKKVRQFVQEKQFDLIHAHDYKTFLFAWLIARKTGVTPLATIHGWDGHTLRERLLYYPASRKLLRDFPCVLSVSSDLAESLEASGVTGNRIQVLLNGIDSELFHKDLAARDQFRNAYQIPENETAIGSVGRLEPVKRFDLLIESFAKISKQRPECKLLIAGEGSQRPVLESLIKKHQLENSCQLLGHVEEIRDFYSALDIYIQSSDSEGAPNVVLEAMSMEVPVVATNVGGTSDLVTNGKHGLLIPRRDMPAMVDAVIQTLEDLDATKQRVQAARERVATELNFCNRTRKLESIYEELLSGGHSENAGPNCG